MAKDVELLSFNDGWIESVDLDGDKWFSMKSLTRAMNVDHHRAVRNARKNALIKNEVALITIEVEGTTVTQRRQVVFMSEKVVLIWILTLVSYTDEAILLRMKLYDFVQNRLRKCAIRDPNRS